MHAITLLHATYSGRVDVVELALQHREVTPATILLMIDVAAWTNQRHVLDFFLQHPHVSGWTCSSFELVVAAREGYLDIVRSLHDQFPNVPSTEDAMDMAAEFGHLDVVHYLHAHRSDGCVTRAMNHAAKNGHLGIVRSCMPIEAKWLVEHRSQDGFTENAFDKAAGNNHLVVVEFLHRLEALSTEKAIDVVAGHGHLSMVQWLHQSLQGCTEEAMDKTAANGHLGVVRWLHEHRSEGGRLAGFCGAARAGHLDVLKWLFANRPDEIFAEEALRAAVEATRVEVVEWLLNRDHDVPKRVAVTVENMNGCIDLIQLLQLRDPKMVIARIVVRAVRGGDLNVIEWMFNRGGHDASALDEAASYGHLHVAQWLHARSFPATTDAMDNACSSGHLHVVRWLHRHRDEGCTRYATAAMESGHVSIVQWLHRHRLSDIRDFSTDDSARSGDLVMIEYLNKHHIIASTTLNNAGAVTGRHFSVVQR